MCKFVCLLWCCEDFKVCFNHIYCIFISDDNPLPGGIQAFSSYPGSIFSGDDFYILSSGLVRTESSKLNVKDRSKLQNNLLQDLFLPGVFRLLWKQLLAIIILPCGSMFIQREPSSNGWGTLWQIDWLQLAASGQIYSASTIVEREFYMHHQCYGPVLFQIGCRSRLWFAVCCFWLIKSLCVDKIRKQCLSLDYEMEQA